jgi:hypothetical protein
MHVRRWCASHASCCGGAWGSRSLARVDWLTAASFLCFLSSLRAEAVTCREDGVSGTQRLSAGILIINILFVEYKQQHQSGAAEAWWAHNPQVPGSKPGSDNVFLVRFFFFSLFAHGLLPE